MSSAHYIAFAYEQSLLIGKYIAPCLARHIASKAEDNMTAEKLLSIISREFFKDHNVYRYRMKKIDDLSDEEVNHYCHWYCEENNLTAEFKAFREKVESQYKYCAYLEEYIDEGLCCDIQMIANEYIKSSALTEYQVDREKAQSFCNECRYKMQI